MRYRSLGKSGLQVSVLGLGTNAFGGRADKETSIRVLHHAADSGINFIDTANIYTGTKSEEMIGEAFEGRRHDVILATKVGMKRGQGPNESGSSRYHIIKELEGSLRRLRTDYIDLYQIHAFDPKTPLEETLRALDDLVVSGKVRYIGASNYAAWQMMKALAISKSEGLNAYVTVQPGYSLVDRGVERELVPFCVDQGIGIIPYFPLAGGILTGKYAGGSVPSGSQLERNPNFASRMDAQRMEVGDRAVQIAAELGTTATALSLAWLMHRPAVCTVIAGATRESQIDDNLKSVELELSADVMQQLNDASEAFVYARPFGSGGRR
ncbi:1-deoxyxylulose-5-phosphate synthase YajO [Paenibacillus solanacearum]|uniref:1-deoxyxylulose-5-phosphate synthase YajO n=1 Tax=Paenibacillus solanacearum TaxID=2048548 RepID=A0A916NFM7_9BACL|nr:aldo/keto reductase [Paenibacillus solanacearum]CAG7599499.1 1-deoxyxylulose-5-phosphate synthase YajO [Paenibacillus solanacearum]